MIEVNEVGGSNPTIYTIFFCLLLIIFYMSSSEETWYEEGSSDTEQWDASTNDETHSSYDEDSNESEASSEDVMDVSSSDESGELSKPWLNTSTSTTAEVHLQPMLVPSSTSWIPSPKATHRRQEKERPSSSGLSKSTSLLPRQTQTKKHSSE